MPNGYELYKAQDGTGTGPENRARGVYPNPVHEKRAEATRGDSWSFAPAAQDDGGGGGEFDDFLEFYKQYQAITNGGPLGGNSTSQSTGSTIVIPPVLELLAEMRARRESEQARAQSLSGMMADNLPRGMTHYPGFEMGGLADVLLGIITGQGVEHAQSILPENQRTVKRTEIPVPGAEPPVGEEIGGASSMAEMIMNALRNIQTSQSSSSSSSG